MCTQTENPASLVDAERVDAILRILKGRTTIVDEATRLKTNVATLVAWMKVAEIAAKRNLAEHLL